MTQRDIRRAVILWITNPSAYNKNVGTTDLLCLDLSQSDNIFGIIKDFFRSPHLKDANSYASARTSLVSFLMDRELPFDGELDLKGRKGVVRFIIPKNGVFRPSTIDLVICDFENGIVDFHVLKNEGDVDFVHNYAITFDSETVTFTPKQGEPEELSKIEKLLLSKIDKWSLNEIQNSGTPSLSLVSQEEYFVLYNNMKKKYCESIRKIWQESTDPDKFIHEDVAIATYLILLWGRKPIKFVDLGCGNGLLVHILASEGYTGLGIDVRSRKIWSSYPPTTVLKEETFVPSPSYVFPDADWIIGNHSDELTPWIPIISLLSSDTTNFFLLPCCAYEFSGVKYKRVNAAKSQYAEYLDYVQDICVECGFLVFRDRLKIPSTKRICLVSRGRTRLTTNVVGKAKEIISRRGSCIEDERPKKEWLTDFKARDNVERVRNCTQLDQNFVTRLLLNISNLLLVEKSGCESSWNCGNPTDIPTLAKHIDKEDLQQLKNECGGLQTFLRNHHFIFKISEGEVAFRKPEVREKHPKAWKVKPCWFFTNHPQSCPLEDQECSFIHCATEERPPR
uniref:tRNA (uracil-O(2)-)-methyltransferase n=1 Tax=Lygus hesperus TaxID=30085 RepID=A0A0K8SGC5_LYGHE